MKWMKPISLFLSIVNSICNGVIFGIFLAILDGMHSGISLLVLSTWIAAVVIVVAGAYVISYISWMLALLISGWLNVVFVLSIAAKWGFELLFAGSIFASIAAIILSITNSSIAMADVLFPDNNYNRKDEWTSAAFLLLCVSSVLLQIIKYFTADQDN